MINELSMEQIFQLTDLLECNGTIDKIGKMIGDLCHALEEAEYLGYEDRVSGLKAAICQMRTVAAQKSKTELEKLGAEIASLTGWRFDQCVARLTRAIDRESKFKNVHVDIVSIAVGDLYIGVRAEQERQTRTTMSIGTKDRSPTNGNRSNSAAKKAAKALEDALRRAQMKGPSGSRNDKHGGNGTSKKSRLAARRRERSSRAA
ncbi:MAG: hypothetical protein HQL31_13260 [Planctomycetes bacterium]|nr:hypothetical protein [Planctomycetota bacterium]